VRAPATNRPARAAALSLAALASLFCVARAGAEPNTTLLVSAAVSLKDALADVAAAWQHVHPDIEVNYNFGGSGSLELQIEQGAPADVFISAAEDPMDKLAAKGLLQPETRMNLLENRLVLIVPKGRTGITTFVDLTRADVKTVALGDPRSVPAGTYAKELLGELGIYDAVARKAVFGSDVRQVLAYVETASADAGIVYATDAAITSRVQIAAEAPASSRVRVIYPAAVLKQSNQHAAARAFLDFLKTPEAQAIFRKYGFRTAAPQQ